MKANKFIFTLKQRFTSNKNAMRKIVISVDFEKGGEFIIFMGFIMMLTERN